jgi:hypothetical protein
VFSGTWGIQAAAVKTRALSAIDYIETLAEVVPKFRTRIPFYLLGVLVSAIRKSPFNLVPDGVASVLQALEAVRDSELDPGWLKLTSEFVEDRFTPGSFDLLERSLEMLERVETEMNLDSNLVSSAREYVLSLLDSRKRLSLQPDDLN